MTTERQKKAVAFCETWLKDAKFTGDINNFNFICQEAPSFRWG